MDLVGGVGFWGELLSFGVSHSFFRIVPNLGVIAHFWRVSRISGKIQAFLGKVTYWGEIYAFWGVWEIVVLRELHSFW